MTLPSGVEMVVASRNQTEAKDVAFGEKFTLDEMLAALAEFGDLAVGALKRSTPSQAEVEFSVGVDVSTGKLLALFCDANTDFTLKVRLLWEPKRADLTK